MAWRTGAGVLRVGGEIPRFIAVGDEDQPSVLVFDAELITVPPYSAAVPCLRRCRGSSGRWGQRCALWVSVRPDFADDAAQGSFGGSVSCQNLELCRHPKSLGLRPGGFATSLKFMTTDAGASLTVPRGDAPRGVELLFGPSWVRVHVRELGALETNKLD